MSGTAEQEERAKWRANERADRAEAYLDRLLADADGKPFVVRQFEGKPWVPLHEAARLNDALQKAGLTIAALRNELAVKS